MKAPKPNRSKLERAFKRRDKQRRHWCRRCPFRAPKGRCLDTTLRNGRCGDWVYYLLPGNKQCRRRWVRPKDPRTPAQRQNRARLATASRKYSTVLTEPARDACIAAGAKRQSRRRMGQSGPLTGQQYLVHKAYVKTAAAKVQNTRIPAQMPKPQRVTRPTWGLHRGISRVPPGKHRRRWQVAGRRHKVVAVSGAPQSQRVTRSTRERYRAGFGVARVPRRRDAGPSRLRRARLTQRMGVRPMPAHRPAAQPCAGPARAPGGQFDGGNSCRKRQ